MRLEHNRVLSYRSLQALDLDPVNLSAAFQLIGLYKANGDGAKADELSRRLTSIVQAGNH